MKKLIAVLAVCLLGVSADAQSPDTRDTFRYACQYADFFYNVQCGDLERPTVVKSKVVSMLYYGFYYRGEKYIFINPTLDEERARETIVHETMHYILDWKSPTEVGRCESEEKARRAQKSWTGSKYNDDWRERYNC